MVGGLAFLGPIGLSFREMFLKRLPPPGHHLPRPSLSGKEASLPSWNFRFGTYI